MMHILIRNGIYRPETASETPFEGSVEIDPLQLLKRAEELIYHKTSILPVWLTKEDAQLKPLYEQLESEI